ncbi:MAG: ATP synthase F1 subunit delta [Candidatus Binatia bacterium]|nr:ATP synthase F1 subunit delta [Candidatus Binatia bacterium]
MLGTKAAKRYAKAVFELAEEQGVAETVAAELSRLAVACSDPTLRQTLALPLLPLKARKAIAEQIAAVFAVHPLTGNFLRVLAENDRLADLVAIERAYRALYDRARGRVHATIRLATSVGQEELDTLVEALCRLTGKTVVPTVEIDPDLLGGAVVELEGRVYDASLKTQLHRLEETLVQQA